MQHVLHALGYPLAAQERVGAVKAGERGAAGHAVRIAEPAQITKRDVVGLLSAECMAVSQHVFLPRFGGWQLESQPVAVAVCGELLVGPSVRVEICYVEQVG